MQDCKPPTIPINARISNPSNKYHSGYKVTFKCNEGYNQEGMATQMCFLGSWTVLPFKCTGGSFLYSLVGFRPQGLSLQTTNRSMFRNLSKATSTSKQFSKLQLVFHSKNIKFEIKNRFLSFRARPHIVRVVMIISLNTSIQ